MDLELILTKDGSHSLLNKSLNETYHSTHGALQESEYIYIDKGVRSVEQEKGALSILEVGFGTGLNALLSYRESLDKDLKINYHTLEPYPISAQIVERLNYAELVNSNELKEKFQEFHKYEWEKEISVNANFNFVKLNKRLEDFVPPIKYHLVFFDAFAPSRQPDIWALENLKKIKDSLNQRGFLVTYCSSSRFKKDLIQLGFRVESLPGPQGKREITRAFNS